VSNQHQPVFIPWRYYLIIAIIATAVLGLVWRVIDLAIFDQHFLRHQGDERFLREVSTPAFRGMILDRNGFPLAISTRVYSAWYNPQTFNASKKELNTLAKCIDMKPAELQALVKRNQKTKREFIYIKRSLSPEVAANIKKLNIAGVYTQEDYRRFYPEGEVTSHVVGFTNVDDHGQEGLELGYNNWLQGEQGKKWVIKDRLGRIISDVQLVQEQKPGRDLTLSIDRRIQYLAYRELLKGVVDNQAVSGTVVVLDAKTGEILAMVNQPSFNPNNRPGGRMSDHYRNRAVTDTFEPGSTIKPFSVASALDSGHFKPNTLIDTSPGWIRLGHNVVMDHQRQGVLTVTQVLQKSSNVGVTKMVLSLPANQLWDELHNMGFGEPTGIAFPGEQDGSLVKHDPWGQFVLATMAFGYGISATPLQLARAYIAIANNGVLLPISLLKLDTPPTGVQVMNKNRAHELLTMLETVVQKGGTAEAASVPGYRVAGKTGTAKLVGPHGYMQHRYTSTFIGIAPVTSPRLVVAVIIHDPQGKQYYGGQVSGPVFSRIMEGTLRILDIPPDEMPASTQK
jgi:cell division protein FtsI (penicillin-binding protein 3)